MIGLRTKAGRRFLVAIKRDDLFAELLKGSVGSMVVQGSAVGLTLLVAIVLARVLGPQGYGVYAFVFSLISLLAIPTEYGLPSLIVRETAKAHMAGKLLLLKGVWRWADAAVIVYSSAVALALGIAACLLFHRFTGTQLATFGWGLLLLPLMSLCKVRGANLRGLRYVVTGQLPDTILRPLFLIVITLLLVLFSSTRRLSAADAMLIHGVAALLAVAAASWMLMKRRPKFPPNPPPLVYHTRAWTQATLSLAFLAGSRLIGQHIGVLVLGLFATQTDIGTFKVAAQGGALVTLGIYVANMTMAPHFARLYAAKDTVQLQRVATLSARISLMVALPATLIFAFLGRQILAHVFGPEFADGYTALVIMAIGQVSNAAVGATAYLLNMTGHERDMARTVGYSVAACVALNFALIPIWGIDGAATAMALSILMWNVMLWIAVRRRLGIDSFAFPLTRTRGTA